jgi:mannonate dehydratase
MDRSHTLNRRNALKLLAGGGASVTALKTLAGGTAGFVSLMGAMPDPLEAAQVATRRGLPRLKITDIKVIQTQVGNTNMTNAKVITSEAGLYGVGCGGHAERQSIVAQTIEQFLKPAVIGRYCDEIEDIWQMAWLAPYWRASVDANNAMSAIDGALWDILGKRAGMPVHNLLGGKVRPALPMFANINGGDLSQLEENARARMAEGYKHLRVGAVGGDGSDAGGRGRGAGAGGRGGGAGAPAGITGGQGNLPGGGGVGSPGFGDRGPIYRSRGPGYQYTNNLIKSVEHLRKTVGFDVDLLAEVDFRLTPSEALVLGKALEPFRMFWVEEFFAPEDVAWHQILRQQCSTPAAWGEVAVSQIEWVPLVANRWIDFMRMHISACGGLNMARKTAAMCGFFNVRTAWHGPGNVSPVGHAVNTQIDFATPNFGCGEGAPFSAQLQEMFPGCPERKGGMTYSNDLPGLGIDIDEKVAAKFAPKSPGTDRGVRCYDGSACRP